MDEITNEVILQLSSDELGEVLEELTGVEFSDEQVLAMRQLIQAAGSLEAALDMLDDLGPSAEAA